MQKGHGFKVGATDVTPQRIARCVHAMKHQRSKLRGHSASVPSLEGLLAEDTWAVRGNLLGDLR